MIRSNVKRCVPVGSHKLVLISGHAERPENIRFILFPKPRSQHQNCWVWKKGPWLTTLKFQYEYYPEAHICLFQRNELLFLKTTLRCWNHLWKDRFQLWIEDTRTCLCTFALWYTHGQKCLPSIVSIVNVLHMFAW